MGFRRILKYDLRLHLPTCDDTRGIRNKTAFIARTTCCALNKFRRDFGEDFFFGQDPIESDNSFLIDDDPRPGAVL